MELLLSLMLFIAKSTADCWCGDDFIECEKMDGFGWNMIFLFYFYCMYNAINDERLRLERNASDWFPDEAILLPYFYFIAFYCTFCSRNLIFITVIYGNSTQRNGIPLVHFGKWKFHPENSIVKCGQYIFKRRSFLFVLQYNLQNWHKYK